MFGVDTNFLPVVSLFCQGSKKLAHRVKLHTDRIKESEYLDTGYISLDSIDRMNKILK